jgi:NDP-sugar pyrophosphorylase family protein
LTVALFHRDDPSSSGVAALSADDRIREFREKPPPGEESSKWVNAGLLVCEPRVLDFVPESVPSDFARDVIPALIAAGEPVVGYRMDATDSLHWIDTPQDLEAVHELFRERQASR